MHAMIFRTLRMLNFFHRVVGLSFQFIEPKRVTKSLRFSTNIVAYLGNGTRYAQ